MSIGRILIILSAIIFGGFGVAFLLFPLFMASIADIELFTPSAVIDSRRLNIESRRAPIECHPACVDNARG